MHPSQILPSIRPGLPDFADLPWQIALDEWQATCSRLTEVPRGLSRHPIVFVNYDGQLYAIKELPPSVARREYEILAKLEELRIPAVLPAGFVLVKDEETTKSLLVSRYLDRSLPYRSLFMSSSLNRYREHLLDAMAGLLVQLHLAGIFWGDCSLSNTLFRRDAGALQAYLVDAETAESHPPRLSPTLRHHDLEIMENNVSRDLADLVESGNLYADIPIDDTSNYIRQSYRSLWEEITREQVIGQNEHYRIQERIRALNALGFSIKEVEMQGTGDGKALRLRVFVSDRNYHHDQLFELTGIDAQERQARTLVNEILELKATLSRDSGQNLPLSAAAYHWLEYIYKPVIAKIQTLVEYRKSLKSEERAILNVDPEDLYCQVLEHKWYLSERAQQDVGHMTAVEDYLQNIAGYLHFPPA